MWERLLPKTVDKGPIETLSTPPGARFTLTLIALASAMLVLGLRDRSRSAARVPEGAATPL